MSGSVTAKTLRTDLILTASYVAATHLSVNSKDQAVFYFTYDPAEIGAVLEWKFSFNNDDGTGTFFDETVESVDTATGLSTRVAKTHQFVSLGTVETNFEVAIPVAENFVKLEVKETSTLKGDLALAGIANVIGP